jgi:hypothetical protein
VKTAIIEIIKQYRIEIENDVDPDLINSTQIEQDGKLTVVETRTIECEDEDDEDEDLG